MGTVIGTLRSTLVPGLLAECESPGLTSGSNTLWLYNFESKPDLQIMLLCEMWPQDTGQFRPDT